VIKNWNWLWLSSGWEFPAKVRTDADAGTEADLISKIVI
jgi:hypothetical protein